MKICVEVDVRLKSNLLLRSSPARILRCHGFCPKEIIPKANFDPAVRIIQRRKYHSVAILRSLILYNTAVPRTSRTYLSWLLSPIIRTAGTTLSLNNSFGNSRASHSEAQTTSHSHLLVLKWQQIQKEQNYLSLKLMYGLPPYFKTKEPLR